MKPYELLREKRFRRKLQELSNVASDSGLTMVVTLYCVEQETDDDDVLRVGTIGGCCKYHIMHAMAEAMLEVALSSDNELAEEDHNVH